MLLLTTLVAAVSSLVVKTQAQIERVHAQPKNHDLSAPYFVHGVVTDETHDEYWRQVYPRGHFDQRDSFRHVSAHYWEFRDDAPIIDVNILSNQHDHLVQIKCGNDVHQESPLHFCVSNEPTMNKILAEYLDSETASMYLNFGNTTRKPSETVIIDDSCFSGTNYFASRSIYLSQVSDCKPKLFFLSESEIYCMQCHDHNNMVTAKQLLRNGKLEFYSKSVGMMTHPNSGDIKHRKTYKTTSKTSGTSGTSVITGDSKYDRRRLGFFGFFKSVGKFVVKALDPRPESNSFLSKALSTLKSAVVFAVDLADGKVDESFELEDVHADAVVTDSDLGDTDDTTTTEVEGHFDASFGVELSFDVSFFKLNKWQLSFVPIYDLNFSKVFVDNANPDLQFEDVKLKEVNLIPELQALSVINIEFGVYLDISLSMQILEAKHLNFEFLAYATGRLGARYDKHAKNGLIDTFNELTKDFHLNTHELSAEIGITISLYPFLVAKCSLSEDMKVYFGVKPYAEFILNASSEIPYDSESTTLVEYIQQNYALGSECVFRGKTTFGIKVIVGVASYQKSFPLSSQKVPALTGCMDNFITEIATRRRLSGTDSISSDSTICLDHEYQTRYSETNIEDNWFNDNITYAKSEEAILGDIGTPFHGKTLTLRGISNYAKLDPYYTMQILSDNDGDITMVNSFGSQFFFDCNSNISECDLNASISCIFGTSLVFNITNNTFSSDQSVVHGNQSWNFCNFANNINATNEEQLEAASDQFLYDWILEQIISNLLNGIIFWDPHHGSHPHVILIRQYEMTYMTAEGLIEATSVIDLFQPNQTWSERIQDIYYNNNGVYFWVENKTYESETVQEFDAYLNDEQTKFNISWYLDTDEIVMYFGSYQVDWLDCGAGNENNMAHWIFLGSWVYTRSGEVYIYGTADYSCDYINVEMTSHSQVHLWYLYDGLMPSFQIDANYSFQGDSANWSTVATADTSDASLDAFSSTHMTPTSEDFIDLTETTSEGDIEDVGSADPTQTQSTKQEGTGNNASRWSLGSDLFVLLLILCGYSLCT